MLSEGRRLSFTGAALAGALSLLCPPRASGAAPLESSPFQLYNCEAIAYKDYEDPASSPFRDLKEATYSARFQILRDVRLVSLVAFATYASAGAAGKRAEVERRIVMFESGELRKLFGDRRRRARFFGKDPHGLLNRDYATYLSWPHDERQAREELLDSISFPRRFNEKRPAQPFPVMVKLVHEEPGTAGPRGAPAPPRRSVLYMTECYSTSLTEEEYVEKRRQSFGATAARGPISASRREAFSFPNVREALAKIPVRSTDGELLGGHPTEKLVGIATVAAALQLARALLAGLSRNPALAAYFVADSAEAELRLDGRALGLPNEEIREFLRASPAEQAARCEERPEYRAFCEALAALDFALACREDRCG